MPFIHHVAWQHPYQSFYGISTKERFFLRTSLGFLVTRNFERGVSECSPSSNNLCLFSSHLLKPVDRALQASPRIKGFRKSHFNERRFMCSGNSQVATRELAFLFCQRGCITTYPTLLNTEASQNTNHTKFRFNILQSFWP